jgi:hypothetical protein
MSFIKKNFYAPGIPDDKPFCCGYVLGNESYERHLRIGITTIGLQVVLSIT